MSKYKDINTEQEYDEIPQGKVLPLIVNGLAVTEGAYDRYYNLNPTELPELVVVPELKGTYNPWEIPVFSKLRTESLRRHPRAVETAGSSLETLGEFIDANLPGVSKVASPSWWLGNIGQGYIENPFDYNIRNRGIFEFAPLLLYANEWYAPWVNLGIDLGTGYGGTKFVKWGTTPRLIGQGAESEVWSAPLSPYVTKIGGDVDYIQLKNTLPRFLKQKYIGTTSEGIPRWRLLKSIPSKGISNEYRQSLAKENFYPAEFDGYDLTLAFNPERQIFMGDFDNNLGRLWWNPFRLYAYDLSALTPVELLSIMKKGGKLISKKFKSGGTVLKYGLGDKLKKGFSYIFNGLDGTFLEAFRKARENGLEYFRWNWSLYNTKLKLDTDIPVVLDNNLSSNNIYSSNNDVYYNIPDSGIQLIIDSEGMGPTGYEGYWYKRYKDSLNGETAGWDGWLIGNGLSKKSYSNLINEFGDPDSADFAIKDITINNTKYKIAIPKNNKYQPLTVSKLSEIMRNNRNIDFSNLRQSNLELYNLIELSPSYVLDALYSLYHLYGGYVTDPTSKKYHKNDTPRIINALKNKNYKELAEIIRNYDKTYVTRRNREADYILNNLK